MVFFVCLVRVEIEEILMEHLYFLLGTTRIVSPKFGVILGENLGKRVVDEKTPNSPSLSIVIVCLTLFSLFIYLFF